VRTFDLSGRAATAIGPDQTADLAYRARQLGANVTASEQTLFRSWSVLLWSADRKLRLNSQDDLAGLLAFALERWAQGCSDEGYRWAAGPDGLAHAHSRAARTLCDRPAVPPRFEHPELARCYGCLCLLDGRWPVSEEQLFAGLGREARIA
jgi:hypothetical protein